MSYTFTMTAKEARERGGEAYKTKSSIEAFGEKIKAQVEANEKDPKKAKNYISIGYSKPSKEIEDYFTSLGYSFKWIVNHWELSWE